MTINSVMIRCHNAMVDTLHYHQNIDFSDYSNYNLQNVELNPLFFMFKAYHEYNKNLSKL